MFGTNLIVYLTKNRQNSLFIGHSVLMKCLVLISDFCFCFTCKEFWNQLRIHNWGVSILHSFALCFWSVLVWGLPNSLKLNLFLFSQFLTQILLKVLYVEYFEISNKGFKYMDFNSHFISGDTGNTFWKYEWIYVCCYIIGMPL